MLTDKNNVLVRPFLWEDPWENQIVNLTKKSVLVADNTSIKCDVSISQGWYGQCWSCCAESDALWRAYTNSGLNRSVKIETTYKQLNDSLKLAKEDDPTAKFYLNYVEYPKNYQERFEKVQNKHLENLIKKGYDKDTSRMLAALLTKRYAYKFEEEIRLLVHTESNFEYVSKEIYAYTIDISSMINSLELDPWTPYECAEGIIEVIKHPGFRNFEKWDVNISRSSLYDDVSSDMMKKMKIFEYGK